MEKIAFTDPQTGEEALLYVIEETRLAGCDYLLAAEEETADCDAYIMKLVSEDEAGSASYIIVDDEQELDAVRKVFSELLEDIVFE